MVWFFLAGYISGAVGMLMLGKWYFEKENEDDEVR